MRQNLNLKCWQRADMMGPSGQRCNSVEIDNRNYSGMKASTGEEWDGNVLAPRCGSVTRSSGNLMQTRATGRNARSQEGLFPPSTLLLQIPRGLLLWVLVLHISSRSDLKAKLSTGSMSQKHVEWVTCKLEAPTPRCLQSTTRFSWKDEMWGFRGSSWTYVLHTADPYLIPSSEWFPKYHLVWP